MSTALWQRGGDRRWSEGGVLGECGHIGHHPDLAVVAPGAALPSPFRRWVRVTLSAATGRPGQRLVTATGHDGRRYSAAHDAAADRMEGTQRWLSPR